MKKIMKAVLVLMAILTVTYVCVVTYANANSSSSSNSNDYKDPIEYGVWHHFFAEEPQQNEPEEWYTPEELGIVLVPSKVVEDCYHIFIVDAEKALPWMNGTTPVPYAVKYEGKFYRILGLWVTPGLPESVIQWQIPTGVALGVGWGFSGVLFLRWKKME